MTSRSFFKNESRNLEVRPIAWKQDSCKWKSRRPGKNSARLPFFYDFVASRTITPEMLWINRAQLGDQEAFNLLIAANADRAYRYASRLAKDPEVAGDIVSECWMNMNRSLKTFRKEAQFSTWMYRIISNCYWDHLKREKAGKALSLDMAIEGDDGAVLLAQVRDESPDAFETCVKGEMNRLMFEALETVCDYHKKILLLYYVQGLSYIEIAQTLEIEIGTVKSRLNRARNSLCVFLHEHGSLFVDSKPSFAYVA